ncbi:hypothetical protein J5N97_008576 [Dioscorea zingiberensis]|uniref:Cytochrome P450 n=1 Tax=Dioscorea zingiberensis TaxID=325984 RepID=A0A9D5CVH9_9LILI|nr:hypothetical protein J5N97_008576 [Dioscorea zingiberensis]
MDDYLLQLQSIAALFLFVFLFNLWIQKTFRSKNKEPPQASGGFPVIGHLLLLRGGGRPLYQVLGDMADKHGPAFILRLGSRRTLVVSNCEVAKECFTINDKALSSRPANATARHLGYNLAMIGFAPYGSYWRSLRKISTTELLSNARLDMLRHVMSREIGTCLNELHTHCVCNHNNNSPVKVDMSKWFGDLNFNIVLQIVAGKRFFGSGGGSDEAWRFRNAVTKFFHHLSVSVPSNMFPWLEWMDLGGHVKAMKAVAKEMDSVMVSLLEEHREMRASVLAAAGDRDFMDVMLSLIESDQFKELHDKDTVIKATSLAMLLGGTDTTTTSLTRVLMNLLKNEEVMKKVQTELDEQVGKDRVVTESDMKKLVYLQAVIKESFRLTPSAELLVPRETMEDCVVAGFQVPAGTQVIVNAWKINVTRRCGRSHRSSGRRGSWKAMQQGLT